MATRPGGVPAGSCATVASTIDEVTVAGPLRVNEDVVIPEGELRWRFSRSSGPGGQSVNTADSRVELRFDVAASTAMSEEQRAQVTERLAGRLAQGVLSITASEQRSQLQNRQAALQRLVEVLAKALAPPPPPRRPTRVTRSAVERRLTDKRMRAEKKRLRRPDED
jgi:ribosome-associated protein